MVLLAWTRTQLGLLTTVTVAFSNIVVSSLPLNIAPWAWRSTAEQGRKLILQQRVRSPLPGSHRMHLLTNSRILFYSWTPFAEPLLVV